MRKKVLINYFLARTSIIGTTNVSQGNYRTNAQAGASTSWAMMDFYSGSGTISTCLITPQIDFSKGASLTFYTKTAFNSSYPDRMYVRYSNGGASTYVGTTPDSLGDFGNQLLVLNEGLVKRGYPEDWTQYTVTVPAKGTGASGRFAFHYYIPNSGPTAYWIGIDTVSITACTTSLTTGTSSSTGTTSASATTGPITSTSKSCYIRFTYIYIQALLPQAHPLLALLVLFAHLLLPFLKDLTMLPLFQILVGLL